MVPADDTDGGCVNRGGDRVTFHIDADAEQLRATAAAIEAAGQAAHGWVFVEDGWLWYVVP